jgi:hypothetical protein
VRQVQSGPPHTALLAKSSVGSACPTDAQLTGSGWLGGVSAFAFQGTNAHALLQPAVHSSVPPPPLHALTATGVRCPRCSDEKPYYLEASKTINELEMRLQEVTSVTTLLKLAHDPTFEVRLRVDVNATVESLKQQIASEVDNHLHVRLPLFPPAHHAAVGPK